ncbi:MAG: NlpC/P60 family protein [Actinomycetota bacterium]
MAAILVIILAAVLSPTVSSASSKRQQRIDSFRRQVAAARDKLDGLNQRQDAADEEYLQAQAALSQTTRRLSAARAADARAASAARSARADLSRRAKAAYEGTGSTLGMLLGADSFGEFSDRLEFMDQIAADDSQSVNRATVAGQRAAWAAEELRTALADNRAAVQRAQQKKTELLSAVAAQNDLLNGLQEQLRIALIPPPPPKPPPPPVVTTTDSTPTSSGDVGTTPTPDPSPTGGGGPPAPPAPAAGAQAAINAAYSVIGVPYVYAGASPETGFDCSGLTMWAWAHAGVSLPHSSAMQYAVLPHVDRSQLQPGDLLFFYSPIHHVAMYVGGGNMIHAPHTGGHVEVIPVYWQYYVGAARPG